METSHLGPAVALAARRPIDAEHRRRVADTVETALVEYPAGRGRLVPFGSCVLGTMNNDSDLDVLIDFPSSRSSEAWDFVEKGTKADILDVATSRPTFVDRFYARGRVLA